MDDVKLDMLKRRIIACFVDVVFLGALAFIIHIGLRIIPFPDIIRDFFSGLIFAFFGFLTLAKDGPTWFIEMLRGQSPGKKAMGLIVVKLDGKTNISFRDSIVRNIPMGLPYALALFVQIARYVPFISGYLILMAIPGFLLCWAVVGLELLLMYKDPEMRRWGDYRAETRVVTS